MKRNTLSTRRTYLKTVSAGSVLGLAGCLGISGGGGSNGDNDFTTVSVGTTETGSLGVLSKIIKDREIDKEHGIKFDVQAAAPPDAMQLLQNEAVDTSIFSPQGAAIANTEGSDIRLFGPGLANHISLMTTTENDGISGWGDLTGDTVGVMPSPSGMWNHTLLLLAEMGLDHEEDFDIRTGAPGAIHGFNAKSDVRAHAHFIPVTITAREAGDMRQVTFYPDKFEEIYGHNLQFVPFASRQGWLDENPDAARAARDTMIDAQQLFIDNPRTILNEYQDVAGFENEAQIDIAVDLMPSVYSGQWGQEAVDNVVQQLERSKELGLIPSDAPTEEVVTDI